MSSRRQRAVFAACVLVAAFIIWFDHQPPAQTSTAGQAVTQNQDNAPAFDRKKYDGKEFTVSKVVDGDTIDIAAADGDSAYTRVRLLGIDTPETKHPTEGVMYFGPEAAEFAAQAALGKTVCVFLDSESPSRDKYDRLLAYVLLPDATYLNELLLMEGFAYADLRFRHGFYNRYKQLESAARNQKKGLWQNVTREQLPEWLQKEKPKLLLR